MRRALTTLGAALVLGFAANAGATGITVIDFDTLSDGDKIFNQFSDLGVKFREEWSPYDVGSGGSPGNVTSDYSFSGPNSLLIGNIDGDGDDDDGDGDDDDGHYGGYSSIWQHTSMSGDGDDDDGDGDDDDGGDGDDDDGGSNSLFILFDQPILSFSAYVLGVCGGDGDDDGHRTGDGDDGGDGACAPDIFLNAYDINGDLVGTTGLTGNDVDWMLLSFTSMGTDIFEIELGLAGGSGDGDDDDGGNAFAVDDISFKPVPVPAALWLLGSGLFGLVALRRRNG